MKNELKTYYITNVSDNYRHGSYNNIKDAKKELKRLKGEGNRYDLFYYDEGNNVIDVDSVI